MFTGNEGQFGRADGPFSGDGGLQGPPPADGMFGSAFGGIEEFLDSDGEEKDAVRDDSHEFLNVGLHFFERMKDDK